MSEIQDFQIYGQEFKAPPMYNIPDPNALENQLLQRNALENQLLQTRKRIAYNAVAVSSIGLMVLGPALLWGSTDALPRLGFTHNVTLYVTNQLAKVLCLLGGSMGALSWFSIATFREESTCDRMTDVGIGLISSYFAITAYRIL